jgi:exonuclease SbcD
MGIGTAKQAQSSALRILLLADTHLGFDLPIRPRIERRRRGHDFAANFQLALEPALRGEVDLVVHGGDLFDRSRVPAALVDMALAPLLRVAETGTPVYIVPGNHERARIPLHLWSAHPNLHIFDRPRTFLYAGRHGTIALIGFPFARRIRDCFDDLLRQAGDPAISADHRLLCMHQTVEGSQVGPGDYTFRSGPDIIPGQDLPGGFDAVLSGHIHRRQVLTHDLGRRSVAARSLPAPVIYPGSVERTSFAERDEEKGYAVVTLGPPGSDAPLHVAFEPLPARPMVALVLELPAPDRGAVASLLASRLRALDPNSIVRVQLRGPNAGASLDALSARCLRDLAPPTMNVDLAWSSQNRPRQSRAFQV